MREETIEIRTPDGIADGFLNRPAAGGSAPGVIMLTDIGGIREVTRKLAQRVADQGFVVLSPNAYYRAGRPPLWSFRPNFGDERTAKRFAELAGPLQPDAIERDAQAYAAFLSSQEGVKQGPLAVVGYCFTGGVALRMAAALPE